MTEQEAEIRKSAIKTLCEKARFCSRIIEMSAWQFEENCRLDLNDLIKIIGEESFQHLIAFYWHLNYTNIKKKKVNDGK